MRSVNIIVIILMKNVKQSGNGKFSGLSRRYTHRRDRRTRSHLPLPPTLNQRRVKLVKRFKIIERSLRINTINI